MLFDDFLTTRRLIEDMTRWTRPPNYLHDAITAIERQQARMAGPELLGLTGWDTAAPNIGLSLQNPESMSLSAFGVEPNLDTAINRLATAGMDRSFLLNAQLGFGALRQFEEITAQLDNQASLLPLQGQMLSETYSDFLENLPIRRISDAIAAASSNYAIGIVGSASARFVTLAHETRYADVSGDEAVRPTVFESLLSEAEAYSDSTTGQDLTVEEAETLLAESASLRVQALMSDIVLLRWEINTDSQTDTGAPVFKPTVKSELYSHQLGFVITASRDSFGTLVQRLYEYLYESSGGWKRVKAYVPTFPQVALRIKHLRTYSEHDIEHGPESEIREKGRRVGDHFEGLIGKRVPASPSDWRLAQVRLLEEIAEFMTELSAAVKRGR